MTPPFSTSAPANSFIIDPRCLFSIIWNSITEISFVTWRIFPQFSHLLRIVPSDGFVLRNGDDPNLRLFLDAPWTQMISVGVGEENDFRITDFTEDANDPGLIFHGKERPSCRSTGICRVSSMPVTWRWLLSPPYFPASKSGRRIFSYQNQ